MGGRDPGASGLVQAAEVDRSAATVAAESPPPSAATAAMTRPILNHSVTSELPRRRPLLECGKHLVRGPRARLCGCTSPIYCRDQSRELVLLSRRREWERDCDQALLIDLCVPFLVRALDLDFMLVARGFPFFRSAQATSGHGVHASPGLKQRSTSVRGRCAVRLSR